MIPKIIHYCWLSNDPIPEKQQRCMDSWRKHMPDYTIVRWDLNRFPLEKNLWVKQAFERKMFAFAADYIRLYALESEGGIYLDSDVEVIKPFDDLLQFPYFICKENSPQGIEAAIIGAKAHTPWIKKCLEYYKERTFVDETTGKEQTTVLPVIIQGCIENSFELKYINNVAEYDKAHNIINIFPSDYFSPKSIATKKVSITQNTYCIHHFAGTWQPLWKKILLYVWIPLSIKFPKIALLMKRYKTHTQ